MENKVMEEVLAHYKTVEERGYEPLFTSLFGSQNYHIDTPESDVDTKTLICPTFKDLVGSNRTVYSTNYGTGIASIIDFREMFKMYYKGSINFVETLFSPYVVYSPEWKNVYFYLRSYRERIARMNPVGTIHAAVGHAHNVARYSNTKCVANVMRLKDFIERFDRNDESYGDILIPSNLEEIRGIKEGKWKDEYTTLVNEILKDIELIADKYRNMGDRTDKLMVEILRGFSDNLMRKVMKKYV